MVQDLEVVKVVISGILEIPGQFRSTPDLIRLSSGQDLAGHDGFDGIDGISSFGQISINSYEAREIERR